MSCSSSDLCRTKIVEPNTHMQAQPQNPETMDEALPRYDREHPNLFVEQHQDGHEQGLGQCLQQQHLQLQQHLHQQDVGHHPAGVGLTAPSGMRASSTPVAMNSMINASGEWVPHCENDSLRPKVGMMFDTISDCRSFYIRYAKSVGFDTRSGSTSRSRTGDKLWKYFFCSRQGFKEQSRKNIPSAMVIAGAISKGKAHERGGGNQVRRKRVEKREGCRAHIMLRSTPDGKFEIAKFHEGHVHPLVTPRRRQFMRSSRKVTSVHKQMICKYARANVGPSKVFHVLKEQLDGYENVGCTQKDFQNYQRDLKALIKDSDAHMFVDIMKKKKEVDPGFYYAYEVDDDKKLKYVFWSDSLCRRSYAVFGDLLSFDTKHNTNRYDMVFGPFTGINNHRQLVCFGAGLIRNEKLESFEWLFEHFLNAMGGNKPKTIITDQDPAIRQGVLRVFEGSTHRFCMWHIMRKLPEKVGRLLNGCEEFLAGIEYCVWGSDTVDEFETSWQKLLVEFNLEGNDWLRHIYDIREDWVQVYFKDDFLGGILRTTSGSESQNSMFGNLTSPNLSLVEFWVRFVHAIESQRYRETKAENDSLTGLPNLTRLPNLNAIVPIEEHGRKVYTLTNFSVFQAELLKAIMTCDIKNISTVEGTRTYHISDTSEPIVRDRYVVFNEETCESECTCSFFPSQGIPCAHIMLVWKSASLKEIPQHYIVNRWTKMAARKPIFELNTVIASACAQVSQQNKTISDTWAQLYKCMDLAGRDVDKLKYVLNAASSIQQNLEKMGGVEASSASKDLEVYFGCSVPLPDEIDIHPPPMSATKGRGKRLKTSVEKAVEKQNNLRMCRSCNKKTSHDSRNCPEKRR